MENNNQNKNSQGNNLFSNKKLSTKIHGLDNLFHGGLHLEVIGGKKPNLMIVIRGIHGTNKIHLAMQMCEGLKDSIIIEEKKREDGKGGAEAKEANTEQIITKVESYSKRMFQGAKVDEKKLISVYEHTKTQIEKKANNINDKFGFENKNMLFVSLNKDEDKVKELFYDFYVKRLVKNIQSKSEGWDGEDGDFERIKGIFTTKAKQNTEVGVLASTIRYLSDRNSISDDDTKNNLQKAFATGVLYYNTRTHGVHIRKQKKNDDSDDTLLLKIDEGNEKLPQVAFWGREKLNEGNNKVDGRTLFYNLVKIIEQQRDDQYYCIMIDGLSFLTPEECEDCPINALIDLMRKKSTIGIINTNDNVSLPKLDSDIIIDLRIRMDEITNHTKKELSISKCLYQKNTYGWHQYKMRNAGVEVIPSLHKTLSRRNYIEESITEALLPLNKVSYSYWLTENTDSIGGNSVDSIIPSLGNSYNDFIQVNEKASNDHYKKIHESNLVFLHVNSTENALKRVVNAINKTDNNDHILFVDLKRSRKDFWELVNNIPEIVPRDKPKKQSVYNRLHFFGFRAGCIYADEFLHILEQQVAAIARQIRPKEKENDPIFHYYKYVHVVLGDLNILQYSYPCLYDEKLFLPTFSALTKGNYMTNYVYLTREESRENSKLCRQLKAIADKEI